MDLNGNREEDESMAPNVHSLKIFFQNQKQPIIRFQQSVEKESSLETTSSGVQSRPLPTDVGDNAVNRTNRVMPRPPIQSLDIKVSPFLKSLVSSQCERSVPPVPKPRKSLQKSSTNNCYSSERTANPMSSDVLQRSSQVIESLTKQLNDMKTIDSNSRTHSSYYLPKTDPNDCQTLDPFCGQTIDITNVATNSESIEVKSGLSSEKQSSTKSKKAFKSFFKRSKLLSLRRTNDPNSGKHKLKKSQSNIDSLNQSQMRPIKPTRSPPKPPVLHFRPAAPLPPTEPNEDYYEDTLTASHASHSQGFELYSDSVESEQIYCSLDNDSQSDTDFYEGIDDYDDGLTHRADRHTYSGENFYEDSIDNFDSDCDPIYEVLPFDRDLQTDSDGSNGSTVSFDDNLIDTISDASSEQPVKCEPKLDSFDRKRNLKAIKLKKKFNLSGDEIPLNAGVVKEDHRGNRYDLFVRKGETVLILRMEGNPPGKYLAKNERSKVGFVDLDNISLDAESVKSIIKSFATHNNQT